MWFLGSSNGLAIVGFKALIFIPRKSVYLSRLGVLYPDIQQGWLGTRYVSPSGWWSVWPYCLGQLFLERGHVSDICRTTMTAAAPPCQLLLSPPAVTVQGVVCQLSSYDERALCVPLVRLAVGSFRPIHNLVGQLLAYSVVLRGSLKLICCGRPETTASNTVQYDCRLIGPKSLRDNCSSTRLDRPFPR